MARTALPLLAVTTAAALTLPFALPAFAGPAPAGLEPAGPTPVVHAADDAAITLTPRGTHRSDVFDESAAEIVAHHPRTQRLFVVNAHAAEVTVVDVRDAAAPRELFALQTTGVVAADGSVVPDGAVANSVSVRPDGLGVVAVESDVKTDDGWLVFFDAAGAGVALGAVRVGALPDMVTITPNGRHAVVANEGEPADDFSVDPEGTVSVVALPKKVSAPAQRDVRTATFHAFEGDALPDGVRVFGPDVPSPDGSLEHRVSRNLEPEYVAVAPDSRTAYVALQEANAIAVVDIASAEVTDIWPLGYVDHSVEGSGIDPSDRDGVAQVRTVPVKGVRMPDSIEVFSTRGSTYIVTANEGDAREWGDYTDAVRAKSLGSGGLAPVCADSPAAGLLGDADLGRLNVLSDMGLRADGSCYEQLYSLGSRGFSVFTVDGELVFDSGDQFEQILADVLGDRFNTNHRVSDFESRSDDKGPEPEAVTVGKVAGRTYAFVGLERTSGVMVYDVTVPAEAEFVTFVSNRDYAVSVGDLVADGVDPATALAAGGDLGPEGMVFIPAGQSPTRTPVLVVANEVSGTTTLFEVERLRR